MNHSHLESIAISALFRFAHFWKVQWRRPYFGGCTGRQPKCAFFFYDLCAAIFGPIVLS
jgi:hypothetical protein